MYTEFLLKGEHTVQLPSDDASTAVWLMQTCGGVGGGVADGPRRVALVTHFNEWLVPLRPLRVGDIVSLQNLKQERITVHRPGTEGALVPTDVYLLKTWEKSRVAQFCVPIALSGVSQIADDNAQIEISATQSAHPAVAPWGGLRAQLRGVGVPDMGKNKEEYERVVSRSLHFAVVTTDQGGGGSAPRIVKPSTVAAWFCVTKVTPDRIHLALLTHALQRSTLTTFLKRAESVPMSEGCVVKLEKVASGDGIEVFANSKMVVEYVYVVVGVHGGEDGKIFLENKSFDGRHQKRVRLARGLLRIIFPAFIEKEGYEGGKKGFICVEDTIVFRRLECKDNEVTSGVVRTIHCAHSGAPWGAHRDTAPLVESSLPTFTPLCSKFIITSIYNSTAQGHRATLQGLDSRQPYDCPALESLKREGCEGVDPKDPGDVLVFSRFAIDNQKDGVDVLDLERCCLVAVLPVEKHVAEGDEVRGDITVPAEGIFASPAYDRSRREHVVFMVEAKLEASPSKGAQFTVTNCASLAGDRFTWPRGVGCLSEESLDIGLLPAFISDGCALFHYLYYKEGEVGDDVVYEVTDCLLARVDNMAQDVVIVPRDSGQREACAELLVQDIECLSEDDASCHNVASVLLCILTHLIQLCSYHSGKQFISKHSLTPRKNACGEDVLGVFVPRKKRNGEVDASGGRTYTDLEAPQEFNMIVNGLKCVAPYVQQIRSDTATACGALFPFHDRDLVVKFGELLYRQCCALPTRVVHTLEGHGLSFLHAHKAPLGPSDLLDQRTTQESTKASVAIRTLTQARRNDSRQAGKQELLDRERLLEDKARRLNLGFRAHDIDAYTDSDTFMQIIVALREDEREGGALDIATEHGTVRKTKLACMLQFKSLRQWDKAEVEPLRVLRGTLNLPPWVTDGYVSTITAPKKNAFLEEISELWLERGKVRGELRECPRTKELRTRLEFMETFAQYTEWDAAKRTE